jgi:hypothetical protein
MPQYEYAITVHSLADVSAKLPAQAAEAAPDVLYCDSQGDCFFDDSRSPYIAAIEQILNEQGAEQWALIQLMPREQDMICFWRRQVLRSE